MAGCPIYNTDPEVPAGCSHNVCFGMSRKSQLGMDVRVCVKSYGVRRLRVENEWSPYQATKALLTHQASRQSGRDEEGTPQAFNRCVLSTSQC